MRHGRVSFYLILGKQPTILPRDVIGEGSRRGVIYTKGKGRGGEEGRRMDMGAGDLDVPKNNTLCGPTAVLTSRSAATGTQQLVVII